MNTTKPPRRDPYPRPDFPMPTKELLRRALPVIYLSRQRSWFDLGITRVDLTGSPDRYEERREVLFGCGCLLLFALDIVTLINAPAEAEVPWPRAGLTCPCSPAHAALFQLDPMPT